MTRNPLLLANPTNVSCWARCNARIPPLSGQHSCLLRTEATWFDNPPAGRLFLLQFSFLLSAAPKKCCNRTLSSTHFPIYRSTSLFPILHYITCAIVTVSLNELINHKLLQTLAADKEGRIFFVNSWAFTVNSMQLFITIMLSKFRTLSALPTKRIKKETNANLFLHSSVRYLYQFHGI